MKRLLLKGALVALFSFGATAAHADDAMNTRVLKIIIIGTTKAQPKSHELARVWLPMETRFTCEEAVDQTDLTLVTNAARIKLKHSHVLGARAVCVVAGPIV